MKKIFVFVFVFLLYGSINNAFLASFNDVLKEHNHYNAIEYLKENSIIEGYSDGTFRPDNKINRAEALKIIVEAFDVAQSSYDGSFSDVKSSDWYANYVSSAKKAGIIQGYTDNTFRGSNSILKSEAFKIVLIGTKMPVPEKVERNVFVDVGADLWYSPFVLFARENNLILADDLGKIYPSDEINRGQFAEIIYRTMIVKESNKAFDLATNWPTYESTLGFSIKYNAPRWKIINDSKSVTIYNTDEKYGDLSAKKVFLNSAKIQISVDLNEEKASSSVYFDNLKKNFSGFSSKEFKFKEMPAIEFSNAENRTFDWYVYSPSGAVYGIFTEYGAGILAFQFPKEIIAMLNSFENSESKIISGNKEEVLSEIYSNILIKGKGMSSLDKILDKIIIETDTIGVGTGAVDYYYSENLDLTFKYERSEDLILDKRDGRTSAF